ncbi:MAG: 3-phosphoserine/phosphohydroxythreonine transaminase [Calditrichaeota bacterium]|nr:MAG: 3-phosphoserine/phosphohydroxythreonine transaminase [Calditrichota bacterium]MBL1204880.1 3-phosphoserine/phosphohydroxythreonine transaminase [Calditrichota bacterium]NOG44709.1 3-phosphoserine/phosphohydroxythreonine transaminase [Calditrichota bacterium]
MVRRIHNFSAGPAALPLSVLEEVQKDLVDYKGEGLSVMEMSHRGKTFDGIIVEAQNLMKELMGIPDGYKVLFMQGGASLQFATVPMNLLGEGQFADYINTGAWSKKAIAEVKKLGLQHNVIASSEDKNFNYIPTDFHLDKDAAYLHMTSNNTIFGTQWQEYPDTGVIPLVCDMSSDINSRVIDVSKFAMIYAGAQKNMGPSGVTIVIIREDLLEKSPANLPTMCSYKIIGDKDSMYNTPPTFGIYIIKLVMEWMKSLGGIKAVEEINKEKGAILYNAIDSSDFYRGTVEIKSRSLMNIPFRLPSEDLEKQFIAEALENDISGVKGHRSVGGIRASTYNAVPMNSVKALVDFMKEFERKNG